jgi:hypothetical protein
MEPRDEYTALGAWLFAKLRAEFGSAAVIRQDGKREGDPEGRAFVYTITPLPDTRGAGDFRALSRFTAAVRVIDRASSSWPLGEDAARVDQSLHGAKNEVLEGGYTLTSCVRESPYAPPPVIFKGVEHRQLGGVFRVLVQ